MTYSISINPYLIINKVNITVKSSKKNHKNNLTK